MSGARAPAPLPPMAAAPLPARIALWAVPAMPALPTGLAADGRVFAPSDDAGAAPLQPTHNTANAA
jgi:hypothetical protein